MILALTALVNAVLSYFGIDLYILSYIGGVSIFTIIFLYLSSYVFKISLRGCSSDATPFLYVSK